MEEIVPETVSEQVPDISEINLDIENFRKNFFKKFKFYPRIENITENDLQVRGLSLERIELLLNEILHRNYPNKFPEGIRTRTRKGEVVIMRQFFFKLGTDYDYGCSEMSRYLAPYDHATVLHGNARINELLDAGDRLALDIDAEIMIKIKAIEQPVIGKIIHMPETAKNYAFACCNKTNRLLLNNQPFGLFLNSVNGIIQKFIELVPEEDTEVVLAAGWCYDLITNCRQQYSDIEKMTNSVVADLVLALTPLKGKTVQEQEGEAYIQGILAHKNGGFLKSCIRVAETEFYKVIDKKVYRDLKSSYKEFKKSYMDDSYWQVFDYMEALFDD